MANNLKQSLLHYIRDVSGQELEFVPESGRGLPLFLRERYALFLTKLFGRKYHLAIENKGGESGTPGRYGKDADTIGRHLENPVVLVLPALPSYVRNRMVHQGTAFIIPGSQTFLPNTLIDLREWFPKPGGVRREFLSPATQCTILYHLLREELSGKSLKEIAIKVQYSPMMLTKVKNELEANDICQVKRKGASMGLDFLASGKNLWEKVGTQLHSPVRKSYWIKWQKPGKLALLAGMSALSQRTMIAADRLPIYALPVPLFQDYVDGGVLSLCPDAEEAKARLEVWSYNPQLLGDEGMVDPLSLYLSLRDSKDERVEQQLEELIQGVEW